MKITKGDLSKYIDELKSAKIKQLKEQHGQDNSLVKHEMLRILEPQIRKMEEVRKSILDMVDYDVMSSYISGYAGTQMNYLLYDFKKFGSAYELVESKITHNLSNFEPFGDNDDKGLAIGSLQSEALIKVIVNVWEPIRKQYNIEKSEVDETIKQLRTLVYRSKNGPEALKSLKALGLDTSRAEQILHERKAKSKSKEKQEVIVVPPNIKAFEGLPKLK